MQTGSSGAEPPGVAVTSAQEQEVLEQLPTASTAEEMAARLHVSVHSVKAHIRSIYRKLGVSRRQDAVAEAVRQGLL